MISVSLHINNLSKAKDSYSSKNIRTNRRIGIEKQLRGFHVKIYLTIGIVAALSIPQCWSQMLALCAGSQCLASLVSLPLWIKPFELSLLELVLVHAVSLTLSEQHICEIIDTHNSSLKKCQEKRVIDMCSVQMPLKSLFLTSDMEQYPSLVCTCASTCTVNAIWSSITNSVSHEKNSFFTRPFYINFPLAFSLLCSS